MPRPTAILIVSAHWQTAPMALSATTRVPLVYDFYGFPEHYYRMTYDAPGAPELAERVRALMPASEPVLDRPARGLDHGAWVPLKAMYPDADDPGPPDVHAGPGSRAPLRDRPTARTAARRGRPHRRLRLPDPRPAVHPRVLPGQARRPAVVDRLRPLGDRGARPRRRRRPVRLPRPRRPACPTRIRPWSTSRRSS